MKVLLMISPDTISGACLSGITLAERLEKMDVDVVLVVKRKTQQILRNKGKGCYVIMRTRGWTVSKEFSKIKQYLHWIVARIWNIVPYFQILRVIKRENPDIVHMDVATGYLAARAAIKCKKSLVWHIRELIEEDFNSRWFNSKKALKLMSRADCIISISKCVYDKFHALLPGVPNRIIYNGIDMAYYENDTQQRFNKENTVFTIAGQIGRHKGQLEVLMGLASILKAQQNTELWIAGHGNETEIERLEVCLKDNGIVEGKVKLLGFVTDMASVWARTDVAVVASRCEAFGRVTVEAMAAGCLVLGANSGATPELVTDGETGLLYQQGNFEDLGRKAEYILEHKSEMQKIAAKGREYAITNFTAEKNAREIKKLYEELLEGRTLY